MKQNPSIGSILNKLTICLILNNNYIENTQNGIMKVYIKHENC